MNIEALQFYGEEELPAVPPFETDRYGNRVDTSGEEWRVFDPSAPALLDWNQLPDGSTKQGLKLWLCFSIRSHSPRESGNQFREIHSDLKLLGTAPSELEQLDITWWKKVRQGLRERDLEYRLHRVRRWYLWMADQEFPGIEPETAIEIEQWAVPGNIKGEAVETRDKDSGPLTDLQFAALIQVLRREQPPTLGQAATMLCVDLGPNPKALCLLEERDLHLFSDPDMPDKKIYQLDIPRIKKRLDRRETKRRRIDPSTGAVLEKVIRYNQTNLGGPDPNRPILCHTTERKSLSNIPELHRFAFHYTSLEILNLVRRYGDDNNLRSPGGGDSSFEIYPRRLRYTFACRLAAQGAPPKLIAELLDHSDLQHVMVYVETAGKMVGRLSAALDAQMRPIVDMFMGRIIGSNSEAVPNDLSAQIPGKTFEGRQLGGIGVCGSGSLCKLMPPLTCYVCEHFQPKRNAPHSEMLEAAHRLRTLYGEKNSATNTGLELIDRVIAHIQGVIEATENLKEGDRA
jgi:integrase